LTRLPVVRRRSHDEHDRKRHQTEGKQVESLFCRSKNFSEAVVEDRDELKAEERLNPGQDCPAFLKKKLRRLGKAPPRADPRRNLPLSCVRARVCLMLKSNAVKH
jgi:hypothetical protein